MAVGTDNLTRLLWNSGSGVFSLWRVNADASVTAFPFGPYAGWTANQVAIGTDNVPRLLWNYSDGTCAIDTVNESTGGFTSLTFGPYPGWSATALAMSNATPRLLWNKTDGTASLYSVSPSGGYTYAQFGPYAGYTARFLAAGPNTYPCLLWTSASGQVALWTNADASNPAGSALVYSAPTGYLPLALTVDANNAPRILWNNAAAQTVSLWTVAADGTYTSQTLAYPAVCTPVGLGVATDGSIRLLWSKSDGSVQVGILLADGTPGPTLILSPIASGNAPQSGGSWVLDHYNCNGATTVAGDTPFTWPAAPAVPGGGRPGTTYNQDGTSYTTQGTGISFNTQPTTRTSRKAHGTISPVFVWSGPGNAPAGKVEVLLSGNAVGSSMMNANDGLGDTPVDSSGLYISAGTHLFQQTVNAGQSSFTVSPPSSFTGYDPLGNYYAGVSLDAFMVNANVAGTISVGNTAEVLTGQQITARVIIPTGYTATYNWSVMTNANPPAAADVFKTYNDQATSNPLVLLGPSDLNQSSLNFYDKSAETIIVQCNVTLTSADGKTTFTVTVPFQPITVIKPSANWVIDPDGFVFGPYVDSVKQVYGVNVIWKPVTITVPSPFKGGTGGFAQLITPNRYAIRHTPGPGKTDYYLQTPYTKPDGTQGWKLPSQGLDKGIGSGNTNGFPYTGYTWDVSINPTGASGDQPNETYMPIVVDQGQNDWYSATMNDSFTTWLMYKYTSSNAVWVPLQKVSWNTNMTVLLVNNSWTYNPDGALNTPASGTMASDYPQWTVINDLSQMQMEPQQP